MAAFSINNSNAFAGTAPINIASSATFQTILAMAASSGGMVGPPLYTGLKRGLINDWTMGTAAAPADTYIEWEVIRVTAASTLVWLGTISSVSSGFMNDPADAGFASLGLVNSSAETNLAAAGGQLWYFSMNQRASYRYITAPSQELVWPANTSATGSNGLALKARGSYTSIVTANLAGIEK